MPVGRQAHITRTSTSICISMYPPGLGSSCAFPNLTDSFSCAMSASRQDLLRQAWLEGRDGNLSALSEARAWALRQVWRDEKKSDHGMLTYVASKVVKIGGGSPTHTAISKLFDKIDDDPGWFPGKSYQEKHGPDSVITPTMQNVVAQSAMAMKERGQEPTYSSVVANNPQALLKPNTGNPVNKNRVYAIMRERCNDDPEHPEDTWEHMQRLSKVALTDENIEDLLSWARLLQAQRHQAKWFYNNLVWTDLCNSILPLTEKRQQTMTLARKGARGWGSKGTRLQSKSLRCKREALKQKSWDSVRVWWAPVLSRGKLHIEVLGNDFPGEKPEGAAILVAKVRKALNVRFQGSDAPDILFVDRGQGFYRTRGGKITPEFKDALAEHGLRAYYGDNAAVQPGNLQEVLLHETSVAWIRVRERRTMPAEPWKEQREDFTKRLQSICQDINSNCDVEGLCNRFPGRVQAVVDAEGDRINK